ncbi:hypothetical protein [Leptolyngbya sp. FACHB-261]|uniref:hypothetical protein n=1 Tax=Leptolyngbya sp. FACHB-261 TaxID=2692806 RepID=UPI0016861A28|nr:hypothetical protein [Leptolyngbya sp. FACHB-261]MBD2104052.1 hypothetical protein [Leptolyngbya sp. FACHB-261]
MSQPTPGDSRLTDFLRQYRSSVPTPANDLEDQIMAAAQTQLQAKQQIKQHSKQQFWGRRRRVLLWVPSALVAGVALSWVSYHVLPPSVASRGELSGLETFLENNWNGVLNDDDPNVFASELPVP